MGLLGGLFTGGELGGWSLDMHSANMLPQDVATGFAAATEKLVGAKYVADAYIAKQLVNGTNHLMTAKITQVTASAPTTRILPVVLNIPAGDVTGEKATIRAVQNTGISDELNASITALLEASPRLGIEIKPILYVASQIVKGVNHYILCETRSVYPNAVPTTMMLVVNQFQTNWSVVSLSEIE